MGLLSTQFEGSLVGPFSTATAAACLATGSLRTSPCVFPVSGAAFDTQRLIQMPGRDAKRFAFDRSPICLVLASMSGGLTLRFRICATAFQCGPAKPFLRDTGKIDQFWVHGLSPFVPPAVRLRCESLGTYS